MDPSVVDREPIQRELDRARDDFHRLLDGATAVALKRLSDGTRWSNEQLLFHMLFGYLIVRTLVPLVRLMGRLPPPVSGLFARVLDATWRPFHMVNYWGSVVGAVVFNHDRMGRKFDRVTAAVGRQVAAEPEANLRRGMHFPPRWDPYFADWMTLAEVYHYATVHFDAHARQLTL